MAEDDMDKDNIIGDDKPKKGKIEENEKSEFKGNNLVDDESENVESSETEFTKKKSSHKEFNKAKSDSDKLDISKSVDDMSLNSDDEYFEDNDSKDNDSKDNDFKEDNDPNKIESEEVEDKGKIRSIKNLSGLFERWFVDYASYVILERAVPYIEDGLKPVQRRILHSMKELDDGRYSKVANIIGNTMKYHPHGDASIGDALVQLGQKDLLIDCQGNWGNILTGDGAAAPRYIEARLSKFATEVIFNPKITEWKPSYDGRNNEPIVLPVRFPLLLAQGVEGIAVGLASKILPHNFIELIDACVAYLRGEDFVLYPDFITGGLVDVSHYADGLRGGNVKVRARIEKVDSKLLKITEIPFGKTTDSLKESIIKANDKGKIKIKNIDDNTSSSAELLIKLSSGVSSDQTIDALYAFTDCEVSISPNSCVIENDKPKFIGVKDILKHSANDTVRLLKADLQVKLDELLENLLYSSLEKFFIEERIYKDKEYENGKNITAIISHVSIRLEPFVKDFYRHITKEDIKRLFEIKMKRIFKFNSDDADKKIRGMEKDIASLRYEIANIIPFAIRYYKSLKEKYAKGKERRTEIRNFENIVASKVVLANEKLYVNREEGFIGTSLKKDEYICECSDLDDVIIFMKDGTYYVTKIADKLFVGKNILYVNVFKKNDKRTVYNVVYRDGKKGSSFVKRFAVTGVTRDRKYDLTKGTPNSKVLHFTVNPNGEAGVIKVTLMPKPTIKKLIFEYDFSKLTIRGRATVGNVLTKQEIHKISISEKGVSTLGGRKIWFDDDVFRLNTDKRGLFLGEFNGNEKILVVNDNGIYYTTSFDLSNHYDSNYFIIKKFDPHIIWTAVYYDAKVNFYYLKRFKFEESNNPVYYISEESGSKLILLSCENDPEIEIIFGGNSKLRPKEIIRAEEFIKEKSYKAKGKRLTANEVKNIREVVKLVVEKPKDEDITAEDKMDDISLENSEDNFESSSSNLKDNDFETELFND